MTRPICDGTVATLADLFVFFTGTTRLCGEHVQRKDLLPLVRKAGGRPHTGTVNGTMQLLVLGGLHPDVVKDRVRVRSKSLIYADNLGSRGHHVCIVDDGGIEALLAGRPARCLNGSTR